MALLRCPCACRPRRLTQNGCPGLCPCVILSKSLSDDLVDCGDPGRSWHENLAGAMSQRCFYDGSYETPWEILVSRSCSILSSSSKSFSDDLVTFFQESWHEDLGQVLLLQLFVTRSCGDPVAPCCQRRLRDLVQVLIRRRKKS